MGTHKLSKFPGVGTKKDGKCPAPGIVAFQHFCSLFINQWIKRSNIQYLMTSRTTVRASLFWLYLFVYKLLLLGHRSLIKKMAQTAVINIVFQRFFIKNLTFRMLVNIHFQKWPLQFLYRNALEYNFYHRCLCYFLIFLSFVFNKIFILFYILVFHLVTVKNQVILNDHLNSPHLHHW